MRISHCHTHPLLRQRMFFLSQTLRRPKIEGVSTFFAILFTRILNFNNIITFGFRHFY